MTSLIAAVPQPPTSLEMPKGAEILFLSFSLVLVVVVVVLGVRNLRRDRDATLLLCAAGGAAASLWEPMVGRVGLMYIPRLGAMRLFTLADRTMPVFVTAAYAGYIGGLAYLCYWWFKKGPTVKGVFALWALLALANVAFETPAVVLDVYHYYGRQPLNLWGFPLWWALVNPLTSMIAGAVIYKLAPQLHGIRSLLIVPLVFSAAGAANGATASPMWLVLNSDFALVWSYAAAVVTLGLTMMVVYIIACAVASPEKTMQDPTAGAALAATVA